MRFSYIYFVRYPVLSAERHYFTEKIVSSYIARNEKNYPEQKISLLHHEPEFPFKAYVFYNEKMIGENAEMVQNAFKNKNYQLNNAEFSANCFDLGWLDNESTTYIVSTDTPVCSVDGKLNWKNLTASDSARIKDHLSFAAVKDSGEVYYLFNDRLCSNYELSSFLRIMTLSQFNPVTMSDELFCKTWLTDLTKLQ